VAGIAGVAKLLAILGVIILGFSFRGDTHAVVSQGVSFRGWLHVGPAFVAIIWAYDGFQSVALLGGEVRTPRRTLPFGLFLGLGMVTLAYLLLNLTYLKVLGVAGVAAAETVAATTLRVVMGPAGERVVAILIMMCTLGTLAAQCVGNPRYFFAPAEDGLFPSWLARLSKRSATPANAITLLAVIAVTLVLSGGYVVLIRLAVLTIYPLICVALLGAIRLRRREGPPMEFSMPLYPLPLVVFCGGIAITCVASAADDPVGLGWAVAMWIVGAIIYRVTERGRNGPPTGPVTDA
jgi:APA family basic amino acid/polyamine antiporter